MLKMKTKVNKGFWTIFSSLFFTLIFLILSQTHDNFVQSLPSEKAPVYIGGNAREQALSGHQTLDGLQTTDQELMYKYSLSDFTEITSAQPLVTIPLPFRLPFFGFSYSYIWIQRNGYLAFNRGMPSYKLPLKFPFPPSESLLEEDPSIIAPWFALQDIPTEVPNAGVYFKIVGLESEMNSTEEEQIRDRIYADFREGMVGSTNFRPKFAMIITWRNMTMANRRPEKPLVTNTYQCVVATDEVRTYAMFNYEQIQWITHLDNFEGLKGTAAYVGFNAGNTTRTLEFKPYSQSPKISYLTTLGYGNGLRGRYFFQIDENIWIGSGIEKDMDPSLPDRLPLTFSPRVGHMFGGTLVNITGPSLKPSSIITCKFNDQKTTGVYRNVNELSCVSPPVAHHGYLDLTVTVDDRTLFLGQYYIQPPNVGDGDIEVLDNSAYMEDPSVLHLKWNAPKLAWDDSAGVSLSLWGYRETQDVYPRLTYIDTLVGPGALTLGQMKTSLETKLFKDRHNPGLTDITFGFISMNLTDPRIYGSPILWSRPIPLGWYFKPQWEREFGSDGKWKEHFCQNWLQYESSADRFETTVSKCPCTLQQAQVDRGRFSPDLECNVLDRKCDTFHKGAQECVRSGRPSTGGSGQTCCYDDYNELLRSTDTMYAGRPSRAYVYGKHPFITKMLIPGLSEWHCDTMPFLMCCKWQKNEDNAPTCQQYNQMRSSQDCSSYQAPGVASVYGDPHFITFDRLNYTFNPKGEFSLLHINNPNIKIDVEGRFERVPRHRRTDPLINATALTAVAARDNMSSVVEFRVRPLAASWRYQMYVIVDKEYVFWWEESMRIQYFRGVTLYQPSGIQNMSHIIAMFDSGAGVEVMVTGGQLNMHVYVPETFMNQTTGLLGKYNKDLKDDFQLSNGQSIPIDSTQKDIHKKYGMSWRIPDSSSSLFFHDVLPFAYFDDPNFVPDFRLSPPLPDWAQNLKEEMESVCSDSMSCRYDFVQTFDKNFAKISLEHGLYAQWLADEVIRKVIRCPSLPKPLNGKKSDHRYWAGAITKVTCDDGYVLTGNDTFRCGEDGLWSTGAQPKCISKA